jgi:proline iminopeptidase
MRLALLFAVASVSAATVVPGEYNTVLNGVRLYYRIAGQVNHGIPPVVFLHGGPGYNSHSFATLAGPQLERRLPMVYLDQRGSGRSERPWNKAYSIDILVDDIEALRAHLGVPQIGLMGHSFGGTLALEYAARYPKHTWRVVFIDGLSDGPASIESWRKRAAEWRPEALAKAVAETRPETNSGGDSACGQAKANQALVNRATGNEGKAFFDSMQFRDDKYRAMQDEVDARTGLQNTGELSNALWSAGLACYRFAAFDKVTMPVLVIGGRYDGAIGIASIRKLEASLPRATFVEYEKSAHFPYLEERERFVSDVTRFLTAKRDQN